MIMEYETTVSKIIYYDKNKKKNEFLEEFREISIVGSLHGPQVPYLKLFSGASPMSCLIFARLFWITLYIFIYNDYASPIRGRKIISLCYLLWYFPNLFVNSMESKLVIQ